MDYNLCRGCMSSNVKLFNLQDEEVGEVFENCTRLLLDQHKSLPPYLCQVCLKKCNEWKKFQTQCEKNEQILIQICVDSMNNNSVEEKKSSEIKEEILLDDYPNEINPFEDIEIPQPFKITVQPIVTKQTNNGMLNLIPNNNLNTLSTIFKCKICKQTFKTISVYENHYKSVHLDQELHCIICDNKFNGEENLVIHQKQFHTVTILRSVHYCGECKTNFTSESEHTDHKNFECDECSRSFCQIDNLKDHLVRIHRDNNQKFNCSQCDKTLSSKSSLKDHIKTHLNEKIFCCFKCGKMFSRNSGLKRHLNEFHSSDPHIYHCHLCPKTFKTLSYLRTHVTMQHNSDTIYSCEICSKTFKRKPSYRRHQMIHENNRHRPHECSICGQKFIEKSALKTHLKKHQEVIT